MAEQEDFKRGDQVRLVVTGKVRMTDTYTLNLFTADGDSYGSAIDLNQIESFDVIDLAAVWTDGDVVRYVPEGRAVQVWTREKGQWSRPGGPVKVEDHIIGNSVKDYPENYKVLYQASTAS